ncbi:MAG TPA: hypothetical protein VMW94_09010 [Actinomycetes bacterium]|nr:hypothetical protein [Actinomycetes bacterium]
MRIEEDVLTTVNGWAEVTYRWTLDEDQLTLEVIRECLGEGVDLRCHDRTGILTEDPMLITVTEHTYVRNGDDPGY